MGNWPAFLETNWFNLVQSVGIIAGLIFTAVTIRRDSKSHRMTALLALEEQHRELWSELHRRPELARILAGKVDLVASPITTAETEFLNTVFVHFCTGWRLAKEHKILSTEDLARDISEFLSRPIPQQVWQQSRSTREKRFVAFVEGHRAKATRPKSD
ncbi:MAG TPA: DUF6082 family protein [Verrucomicrobiota bacterium]|nr:hypothetical protein [Verrucomicrobiales bacterium]HRI12453.1 DUF6082 family protein [Verrucomicrobiota bacterium]